MKRCFWVDEKSEIYIKYHDEEWGVPKYDDKELFELLILESFQAGLSWITILKKREAFRQAFDNFEIEKIINYNETKINELMNNSGIIRCKNKIKSAINNAKILKENSVDKTTVSVGCKVTLRDIEDEEDVEYTIVGTVEVDISENKISNESPLGKALMGKKKGDIVTVQTARSEIKFEILSIA